jgi:hypothetical protein
LEDVWIGAQYTYSIFPHENNHIEVLYRKKHAFLLYELEILTEIDVGGKMVPESLLGLYASDKRNHRN